MDNLQVYAKSNTLITLLVICIITDVILGTLRAIKEKKLNSCIGIDGIIRKTVMVITIVVMVFIDWLLELNFIAILPEALENILATLHLTKVGATDVFCIMYVLFELLSILKNYSLLGLPMIKGSREKVMQLLGVITDELPK